MALLVLLVMIFYLFNTGLTDKTYTPEDNMESKKRTLARMLSYRITAWLFTILWTYMFTGNIGEATGFATLLHLLLSVDYYIHERIWLKIKWGRIKED
jgi:uncharacterized membrane protein